METYADTLELNYWTSSKVIGASQDADKMWNVMVEKGDGSTRIFVVKHLVFAMGYWGGDPNMPHYPGMVTFVLFLRQAFLNIV
jgi:cation diffusion facilitator CzcD-associated flavoprotein CzcO